MGELKQDIHHHPEAMELMLSTNRQKTMEQGKIKTFSYFLGRSLEACSKGRKAHGSMNPKDGDNKARMKKESGED
jgi:hypothetical protein